MVTAQAVVGTQARCFAFSVKINKIVVHFNTKLDNFIHSSQCQEKQSSDA
jgi:hypothetical protein